MPSTIRPLAPSDREDWGRLWTAYLAFYGTTRPGTVFARTWARLQDPAEPVHGLVAQRDGAVIGLCHYIFHRHCWNEADACYLQDLYVDETLRGGGAGRALIKAVYAAADAEGAAPVYWMTQDFNHRARRLYDRVGQKTPFIRYVRS